MNPLKKALVFLRLVRFEHTVFALPFAYLGMLMAARGWPGASVFGWTTAAMACARTAGMCLNRAVDFRIDAQNPRTQGRPTVTGEFGLAATWAAAAVSMGLFFFCAWRLNPLCLKLSPLAFVVLSGYHYVKRFSWLCHFVLGSVLAIAPMGGWIAVTGQWSWVPVPLSLAVLLWVAGFDILYSLQDLDFDRLHGLHSIPVRFGPQTALSISARCHVGTAGFLVLFGLVAGLGVVYWAGVAVVSVLLKVEHSILSEKDLSRLGTAFFTINGWVGVLLLVFTFLDLFG